MENTVEDKKPASQPRIDLRSTFYKKWLILAKLRFEYKMV